MNKLRVIATLQLLTSTGLIFFWIGFFTIGLAPEHPPEGYFVYEHAFPLPDLILAVVMLIAAILLFKDSPTGRLISLPAAGALIFLGVLDFSFNYQNGMYSISGTDLILNAFINLWCFGFGLTIIFSLRSYFSPPFPKPPEQ